jgi:hypothetical protein
MVEKQFWVDSDPNLRNPCVDTRSAIEAMLRRDQGIPQP